jgi:hypothetical protein
MPLVAEIPSRARLLPVVGTTDDLATVLDALSRHDVARLPVCLASSPGHVIGLISRVALLRRYQRGG